MKKAVLYARVSTDEQANNGYSLPHQDAVLTHYCKVNDIEIVRKYVEDFSAKTFDRPEMSKALDFIRKNKKDIDFFLFTKWDRFSRNQEQALKVIRELQNLGVDVNSTENSLDLSVPESKLMLAIYLAVPEVENDKNSQRTKDGMRRAMKEGCFMGKAPLGYIHHRDESNNSTLKLNGDNSFLVRSAFEEFSSGLYSANELRLKYSQKGLKTSKQGFINMLRNVIYIGKIFLPEWKKEPEEIVEGLHPALISENTYQKVQILLSGKKKIPLTLKPNDDLLPLRQQIFCSICGKKFTGAPSKGNGGVFYYYHCQQRCTGNHRAEEVHGKLLKFLEGFEIKDEIYNLYKKILEEKFSENSKVRDNRVKTIIKEVDALREKIRKLEDSIGDSDIPVNRILNIIKRHDQTIEELEDEADNLNKTDKEFGLYLNFGISFLNGLSTYYDTATAKVKKMIIGSIFPEKLIFDGKNYRTVKENSFMALIFNNNNVLASIEKKKATQMSGLSNMAPPLGLEPRTL